MEQTGRIQVERVALAFTRQLLQGPGKERTEAGEIAPRTGEALKETRERRLARHALDAEQRRHHRIASQVGHVREFLRPTEQPLHETEYFGDRLERVVRGRQGMRQALRHKLGPAAPVQERPERRRPGVRAELLVRELNLDGLTRAMEFDLFGHRLVIRAVALRLRFFHSPSVNPRTVACFQLHRYG